MYNAGATNSTRKLWKFFFFCNTQFTTISASDRMSIDFGSVPCSYDWTVVVETTTSFTIRTFGNWLLIGRCFLNNVQYLFTILFRLDATNANDLIVDTYCYRVVLTTVRYFPVRLTYNPQWRHYCTITFSSNNPKRTHITRTYDIRFFLTRRFVKNY